MHIDSVRNALRFIASRSPAVCDQAARALLSSGAAQQLRYDHILPDALADADAGWTPSERAALTALISGADTTETRDERVYVRVSPSQKLSLEAAAAESGTSMSEIIRQRLFG